eukprot:1844774-Rhodomonas_salina.1
MFGQVVDYLDIDVQSAELPFLSNPAALPLLRENVGPKSLWLGFGGWGAEFRRFFRGWLKSERVSWMASGRLQAAGWS